MDSAVTKSTDFESSIPSPLCSMDSAGFEPAASALQERRSTELS